MTSSGEDLDGIAERDRRARREACRILGVDEDADERAVRLAYRRACFRHHPDARPGDKEAHGRFLLVQCAYEMLTKGAICDVLLEEMKNESPAAANGKYNLDNRWGLFMWWREQFFDEPADPSS